LKIIAGEVDRFLTDSLLASIAATLSHALFLDTALDASPKTVCQS
jgi:hypothetical protein